MIHHRDNGEKATGNNEVSAAGSFSVSLQKKYTMAK